MRSSSLFLTTTTTTTTADDEGGAERHRCSVLRRGTFGSLFQLSSLRKRRPSRGDGGGGDDAPSSPVRRPGEDPVEYQCHLPHHQHHRRCRGAGGGFQRQDDPRTSSSSSSSSSSPPRLREEEQHQESPPSPSTSPATTTSSSSMLLCLYRINVWWMRPTWADRFRDVPPETVLLLWQEDDGDSNSNNNNNDSEQQQQQQGCYRLLLPVVLPLDDRNFATATLRGTAGGPTAKGDNDDDDNDDSTRGNDGGNLVLCSSHNVAALYEGWHPTDPHALIQEAAEMASGVWRRPSPPQTSRRKAGRREKRGAPRPSVPTATLSSSPPPPQKANSRHHHPPAAACCGHTMRHALGWCTWNAFATRVTAHKILNGLETLQQAHRIPIRWMILDDGWQDTAAAAADTTTTATGGSNSSSKESDDDNNGDDDFGDGEQWSRRLVSLHEDRRKFPPHEAMTLAETVSRLKERLDAVLVWHTLSGYWLGLAPPPPTGPSGDCGNGDDGHQADSDRRLPPSQLHYPWFSRGLLDNDPRLGRECSVARGIGIADAPADFFQRYHGQFLSGACGIDGVKVDAQGVVGALRRVPPGHAESSQTDNAVGLALQKALVDSVERNFVSAAPPPPTTTTDSSTTTTTTTTNTNPPNISPVIHCMAHAPELFYRLPSLYDSSGQADSIHCRNAKPFFRASDDFYPGNPASHGPQIVACAFNSLLFQHVALPDWDMFQSSLPDENYRRMHAIARCVSGGPIYVSDAPDDPDLSRSAACWDWLCCSDGTTLPCLRAGVPVLANLLRDPLLCRGTLEHPAAASAPPFMIWNVNGASTDSVTSGIVGVFHLRGSGDWDRAQQAYVASNDGARPTKSVQAVVRPFDIPDFAGDAWHHSQFLARSFFSGQVKILESRKDSIALDLLPLQSDAVSFHPIIEVGAFDFVALGMEGRINGAGAVQNVQIGASESTSSSVVSMAVCGCGAFVMAARSSSPAATSAGEKVTIIVSGSPAPHKHHHAGESSGLYRELRSLGFDVFSIDLAPCTAGHEVVVKFERD